MAERSQQGKRIEKLVRKADKAFVKLAGGLSDLKNILDDIKGASDKEEKKD